MWVRAKVQHALRHLPTLFDTGKHEEPQFQLMHRDSQESKQVKSAITSNPVATTFRRQAFDVARANIASPTSRDYHGTQPPDLLSHSREATVSLCPVEEVTGKLIGHHGPHQLREYLASVGSDFLPRSTSTSKASIIVLQSQRETNLKTGIKSEAFSQWLPEANTYIAEIIRSEGRGDSTDGRCSRCLDSLCDGRGIRCLDCHDQGLYCVNCCVFIHSCHPFHRIEVCTTWPS